MNAYFCSGVYHLYNCINLRITEKESTNGKAHLYIFNCFGKAEECYNNIKNLNLFDEVYLVNENSQVLNFKHSYKNKIAKLITLIKQAKRSLNKNDYKNYPLNRIVYDKIYIPGYYDYLHRYFMVMEKHKKDIIFYDEGLGCRINSDQFFINRIKLAKILKVDRYERAFKAVCMYNFNLTENKFRHLERITIENHYGKNKELFYKIFNVHQEDIQKFNEAKIVMLPTGMDYEERGDNTKELFKDENSYYEYINDNYDGVVIKNHPGNKKEYPYNSIDKTIPFELLAGEPSINDKILVSAFSTTVFNAKYLFNAEPYLVLTYKAINLPAETWFLKSEEESEQIINKILINSYSDPDRVFIPKTREEFIEIMGKLSEKVKITK